MQASGFIIPSLHEFDCSRYQRSWLKLFILTVGIICLLPGR